MDLAPGDAASLVVSGDATIEDIERAREKMGLNDPVTTRYFRYMKQLLKGDMGKSLLTNRSVFKTYIERLPNTLLLAFAGIVIALVISIPIGILAALKRGTWVDSISMIFALIGVSMPNFWLGLLLIMFFALKLGWFPSSGAEGFSSIILPAFTVGIRQAAIITRTTRSSMLEVLGKDYIRMAKAKGVNHRNVINKHALGNALIPIITVVGVQLSETIGGAVLTETVFSWPGIGRLIIDSINSRDIPSATGYIILTTMLASINILIVDILYAYIDPRIKAKYSK
jgi:peptide/nickel transport system permease protein